MTGHCVYPWNKFDIEQISQQALSDPLLKMNVMGHYKEAVAYKPLLRGSATDERTIPYLRSPDFLIMAKPKHPTLLTLPLEIRQHIYSYLLAHQVKLGRGSPQSTVWRRGNTAILATSRQIHDETTAILYGDNTFKIRVNFDGIICQIRYLTPLGLKPGFSFPFLQVLSPRTVRCIRNYEIIVVLPDSYMGTIKFNCGGVDLVAGVTAQVQTLVNAIITARELATVTLEFFTLDNDRSMAALVLEPFTRVRNVRKAHVVGCMPEFASQLEELMESKEEVLKER